MIRGMKPSLLFLLPALGLCLGGCPGDDDDFSGDDDDDDVVGDDDDSACEDNDGDGHCVGADCDDTNDAIHPAAYELLGSAIDADCDGVAGGEAPGYGPPEGDEASALVALEPECGRHGKGVGFVSFDEGTSGSVIGASESGAAFLAQTVDSDVTMVYVTDHDGTSPRTGTQFAAPSEGVATLEIVFGSPQTRVLFGFAGFDEDAAASYTSALLWDGALVAEGSAFGTISAEDGWAFVGATSLSNVGFDRISIGSGAEGEFLYLDDVWFCE